MIHLKSQWEIEIMRRLGKIAARARRLAGEMVEPGIKTGQIDREIRRFIELDGAHPAFLGYNGFPGSICISINEELIHGIPGSRKISAGDIVSIDVGTTGEGYFGDCAETFAAGEVSPRTETLIRATRESFFKGLAFCREGFRLSDISHAIQAHVEAHACSVIRDFVGHGIGASLHEAPEVPNFGKPGRGPRLTAGMTLAIEPMVSLGAPDVITLNDGWTVVTKDRSLSAHYENTVLITKDQPEILTSEV